MLRRLDRRRKVLSVLEQWPDLGPGQKIAIYWPRAQAHSANFQPHALALATSDPQHRRQEGLRRRPDLTRRAGPLQLAIWRLRVFPGWHLRRTSGILP